MSFLALDLAAAKTIVSERRLQSVEFEPGRTLVQFIKGEAPSANVSPRLHLDRNQNGRIVLGLDQADEHLIVIDLEGAPICDHSDSEILLILQKLLRFSIKYWEAQRLSQSERLITGSTKAVVFPFPISNQTSYRLSIERQPDRKRMEKRNRAGHFVLVYKAGTSEGGGPQEEAEVTEFRKAIEFWDSVKPKLVLDKKSRNSSAEITQLKVTELPDNDFSKPISEYQGFDRWMVLLTDSQRGYVKSPLTAPHRIEGPAGTGKTLCLILKCIHQLKEAEKAGLPYRALFLAHSDATRNTIEGVFDANDEGSFRSRDDALSLQSLKIRTLHQHCGEILRTKIFEAEYLDRDAMNSKAMQILYIEEALDEAMRDDFSTHTRFMSEDFRQFVRGNPGSLLAEMIQHEIAVVIKGRAGESFENYRAIPKLKYGLPIETESDKGFIWNVFSKYQLKLKTAAQFDTDDVVLSSTGQLNTPIWRRRRSTEGFDGIFVDETHLFNMNELSMFHYLTKREGPYNIAYSVDRSQAVGDRGWGEAGVIELPDVPSSTEAEPVSVKTVFRCSPDIVNLACSVTSSGASLFTNFDNPLSLAGSGFTVEEEQKAEAPRYIRYPNDEALVVGAFVRAESLAKQMGETKDSVAIIAFDDALLRQLRVCAAEANKPVELLERRGDIEVTERARKNGRFVLGHADYVGGLEFAGAVLVGADEGRLPPINAAASTDSKSFLSYASHNRLYVSITRARYRVDILGVAARGISPLLKPAVSSGVLLEVEAGEEP